MGKLRPREIYKKLLQGQVVGNKDFSDARDYPISLVKILSSLFSRKRLPQLYPFFFIKGLLLFLPNSEFSAHSFITCSTKSLNTIEFPVLSVLLIIRKPVRSITFSPYSEHENLPTNLAVISSKLRHDRKNHLGLCHCSH